MAQHNFETKFEEALFKKYSQCAKYLIPKEVYYKTIDDLKTAAEASTTKSHHQYYILKKYELLQCGDVEKLIKKRKSPEDRPVYYATIEDTYDIISKAHIATGHGGRDRMLKHLRQKYANITTDAVELFKSYCVVCQEKRKRPKTTGVFVKPILFREFNSSGQVDLVDMQSSPQGQFKWIMAGEAGDNVAVPIPMVDRGRGDPRNILGVIVDRDEHDMYRIAVKAGILSKKYSRNQFDLCPQ